jgi:acyl-coenzyme A synthetase/AMP-(fatty) acid ligase
MQSALFWLTSNLKQKLVQRNFCKFLILWKILIIYIGEGNSSIKKMTFAELNENVRRYRAALQHIGVTIGDRVVGN